MADLRAPIRPIESVAVDGNTERVGAVGGDRLPLQRVDVHALDAVQAGVRVAEPVPRPVYGQGVRQRDVRLVEEHAPLGAIHIRPLDFRRGPIPIRPEDFSAWDIYR